MQFQTQLVVKCSEDRRFLENSTGKWVESHRVGYTFFASGRDTTITAASPSSTHGEEKKSKASWGAQIVDYEKIAAAAVQAMKAADLNRFLVVCALASELYCPGYNPRQSLEKNSNLASAAGRYKVDTAKIAAAVRVELSKPTIAAKHKTKRTKK